MSLLGFSQRKYEDLFGSRLREIETSTDVAIRVHPRALKAIVRIQLENARIMKRLGSSSRTIAGLPLEHSLVKTSALLTAYILAGTKVMPATEAESTPFKEAISRDIGPALIAHDPNLSNEARSRIERILNESSAVDEEVDLEGPIDTSATAIHTDVGIHQQINDFDLAGINNHVNELKKAGMRVDFELRDAHAGVVRITSENWVARDGSDVLLEIHKVASRPGLLSKRSGWVVQLWSRQTTGAQFVRRGCITANTLVHAFSEASTDMKYGFLSVLSLEDALAD